MIFRIGEKKFRGPSAVDVVRSLERASPDYPYRGGSIRQFLSWSLAKLVDRIPPREMELSKRMDDEALALNYLCLRDEYGAGQLSLGRDNGQMQFARRRA